MAPLETSGWLFPESRMWGEKGFAPILPLAKDAPLLASWYLRFACAHSRMWLRYWALRRSGSCWVVWKSQEGSSEGLAALVDCPPPQHFLALSLGSCWC